MCARRSHRRAALLRTLRWLSKFYKRFVEGVRKSKSGSWNDEFSDNVIFQSDITNYVVVAISVLQIFGNTDGFDRVGSISFICTVVKLIRVTCRCKITNPQIRKLWITDPQIRTFAPCSKDVALVTKLVGLRMSCYWDPGFDPHGMTPEAGPIFWPLSTRLIDGFHFEDCLISDFTSFLTQVISWAKFCSAQEVSTRSIEGFHFGESRFYLRR